MKVICSKYKFYGRMEPVNWWPLPVRSPGPTVRIIVLWAIMAVSCDRDDPKKFVQMDQDGFVLNEEPFFPLVINYLVDLQWIGDSCWAAPGMDYRGYVITSRKDARRQLAADLREMRSAGFNAVRFGLAPDLQISPDHNGVSLKSRNEAGEDTWLPFEGRWKDRYFDALEDVINVAQEEGLRVILLVRMRPDERIYEDHAVGIFKRLKDHEGILAYDLFNEPLYFDLPHHRPKKDVHHAVDRWRELVRKHAPHHLVTIGLVGIREVFAWDPDILDADFISFHPYEYEPQQVVNEMAWYGRHVRSPWIIGETSLPADGDSVLYDEQRDFAQQTLQKTLACGGLGYSWWQYRDVNWGRFHSDFMGLWTIKGQEKSSIQVFRNFEHLKDGSGCELLSNYYNYSDHDDAMITGRLIDEDGLPIEGGVVLAWNEYFSHSYHTVSRSDGTFELYGDMYFYHWIASAIGHEVQRGDITPSAFYTQANGIPAFRLGSVRLPRLSDQLIVRK